MNNVLPVWVIAMPDDPKAKLKYIEENKYGIPEHVRKDLLKRLKNRSDK